MQSLNRKTYYSISLYRFLGILSILCTHCLWILVDQPLPWRTFLLSEPRTGFMTLSGFLYSQRYVDNIKGFYGKNYRKLLLPLLEGIIFLLIANIISMAATNNWNFINVWSGRRAIYIYIMTLLFTNLLIDITSFECAFAI